MHKLDRHVILRAAVLGLALASTACIQIFRRFEAKEVESSSPVRVQTPVKAHMNDGSIVVCAAGAQIDGGFVRCAGTRTPLRAGPYRVDSVPLDSVLGVETFSTPVRTAPTVLVSTAGTVALAAAAAGLAVAIFGSCPTFYADSMGTPVLQAEAFSYAIAPMFEHRDTDRLRLSADADGRVRLEVRNEALETHYLNHVELIESRHARDEAAFFDHRGEPVVLHALRPVTAVTSAAGTEVGSLVAREDGDVYRTEPSFLATRSAQELTDHLRFTLRVDPSADSVALVFRMRNSLLNTVLLYDEILASSGARALDWMGRDLNRISTALDLARWYTANMGMRVQVGGAEGFTTVHHIGDVGPVAYHDVVVLVPAKTDSTVNVRLEFVADNWRIDRIAYSTEYRRARARTIPLHDVRSLDGSSETRALQSLNAADEDYLSTTPGQAFTITFDVGPEAISETRTFFIAAQGYYTEWMRPQWLHTSASAAPFTPSRERLYAALTRWAAKRQSFEEQFYASRIPTR